MKAIALIPLAGPRRWTVVLLGLAGICWDLLDAHSAWTSPRWFLSPSLSVWYPVPFGGVEKWPLNRSCHVRGLKIGQQPSSGVVLDREATVIHLWPALAEFTVQLHVRAGPIGVPDFRLAMLRKYACWPRFPAFGATLRRRSSPMLNGLKAVSASGFASP